MKKYNVESIIDSRSFKFEAAGVRINEGLMKFYSDAQDIIASFPSNKFIMYVDVN